MHIYLLRPVTSIRGDHAECGSSNLNPRTAPAPCPLSRRPPLDPSLPSACTVSAWSSPGVGGHGCPDQMGAGWAKRPFAKWPAVLDTPHLYLPTVYDTAPP
ncbi:hypothetical protein GCM10022226_67830 [Sphaerisporangium flaviroseum]|uniref:Uncharacterized protein n=1 Tax=Sphaerisporangium flaviroseum TaxID=509199 RepID=A0ABP7J806_9ACTN